MWTVGMGFEEEGQVWKKKAKEASSNTLNG